MGRDWSLIEDVFFAHDTPGRIEWFNNPFFNIQEFTVPSCIDPGVIISDGSAEKETLVH